MPEPADTLRDRIAHALEREDARNCGYDHGFAPAYGQDDETDGFVNAVLAVLPPPATDRAETLREAAAQYEQLLKDIGPKTAQDPRYWTGVQHVVTGLRRLAAEAAAGAQQPAEDTATEAGCWCGHPEDRHWADALGMVWSDGCHDCTGWTGAHGYGKDLPWAP
ncbi:hypothetical protein ABZ714_34380 [Streptomyces sp. NPDC006798]|uniref:hypothetical protein n=1 Tax=Streptomyces sp. NPDC006798 TaxID=3155462 RepID=UPI0033C34C6B